jgi:hypothetical protein
VGAFRAAEFIANKYQDITLDDGIVQSVADAVLSKLSLRMQIQCEFDWKSERRELQERMSSAGAFIRQTDKVTDALDGAYNQFAKLVSGAVGGISPADLTESLRNIQLCAAQICYLEAILMQIDYIGSRGGSLVLASDGVEISEKLGDFWRIKPEAPGYRQSVMLTGFGENGYPEISFVPCRAIPDSDGWFEKIWKNYREQKIYDL